MEYNKLLPTSGFRIDHSCSTSLTLNIIGKCSVPGEDKVRKKNLKKIITTWHNYCHLQSLLTSEKYPPIFLLDVFGNIFEKTLEKLLCHFFSREFYRSFYSIRFWVRSLHLLTHHHHKQSNPVPQPWSMHQCSIIDMYKAFSKVWHVGIILKVLQLDCSKHFVILIDYYLSNRTSRVRIDPVLSRPFSIKVKVPQSSVLVPFLFLLWTSDISPLPAIEIQSYANDIIIWSFYLSTKINFSIFEFYTKRLLQCCRSDRLKMKSIL